MHGLKGRLMATYMVVHGGYFFFFCSNGRWIKRLRKIQTLMKNMWTRIKRLSRILTEEEGKQVRSNQVIKRRCWRWWERNIVVVLSWWEVKTTRKRWIFENERKKNVEMVLLMVLFFNKTLIYKNVCIILGPQDTCLIPQVVSNSKLSRKLNAFVKP